MANSQNVIEITDANFESVVLNSEKPVLVDFWAEWCGPCLAIAPTIEALADEFQGKFVVGKMNVDHNSNTPTEYGIRSIPTMLFFKGGKVVDKQIGNAPKPTLKQKMDALA